ncbi:MAG TPA: hypothetical protein VGI20_03500 [Rhizomicrobium sp.]|jgi:hypothetical protein
MSPAPRIKRSFAVGAESLAFFLKAPARFSGRFGIRAEPRPVVAAGTSKPANAHSAHPYPQRLVEERDARVVHAEQSVGAMVGTLSCGPASGHNDRGRDDDPGHGARNAGSPFSFVM